MMSQETVVRQSLSSSSTARNTSNKEISFGSFARCEPPIPALQSIYNWADGQMKEKTE